MFKQISAATIMVISLAGCGSETGRGADMSVNPDLSVSQQCAQTLAEFCAGHSARACPSTLNVAVQTCCNESSAGSYPYACYRQTCAGMTAVWFTDNDGSAAQYWYDDSGRLLAVVSYGIYDPGCHAGPPGFTEALAHCSSREQLCTVPDGGR